MSDEIAAWLEDDDESERELAAAVVEFVRETIDDAEETVKWNNPCFVVADANCRYVAAQNGYVDLGFYEGAGLDDSSDLLEGTGDGKCHVKIHSIDALDDAAQSALVKTAATQSRT